MDCGILLIADGSIKSCSTFYNPFPLHQTSEEYLPCNPFHHSSSSSNRPLSDDVMHTRKFDYYSADHTKGGGGSMHFKYITFYGETQPADASCV